MINRKLLSIIRDQDPLIMNEDDTVQERPLRCAGKERDPSL